MLDKKPPTIDMFFKRSEPIDVQNCRLNKYAFLAYRLNLQNYRLFGIGAAITMEQEGYEIPFKLREALKEEGKVLAVFNMIDGTCVQTTFRGISTKSFYTMKLGPSFPYGIGCFSNDFRYGDSIVVCEGMADRDTLAYCYPNVIAVGNKRLNPFQLEIVKAMTNHVILAYDNDKTGQASYYKDKAKLFSHGIQTDLLLHSGKDAGEVAELALQGKKSEFDYQIARYKTSLNLLVRKH